jgi:hypothetical protein
MITLRQAVDEYLTLRRDMGFKLLQAAKRRQAGDVGHPPHGIAKFRTTSQCC